MYVSISKKIVGKRFLAGLGFQYSFIYTFKNVLDDLGILFVRSPHPFFRQLSRFGIFSVTQVHEAQSGLGFRIALFRCLAHPFEGQFGGLDDPVPLVVHRSEACLSLWHALFSGFGKPFHTFFGGLGDPVAFFVELA